MQSVKEQPVVSFEIAQKWRSWLSKNHGSSNGVNLLIFKKDSGRKSVSYGEALDAALCFGWIDGQKKAFDEKSWIQKFTPRRLKSVWSKRNKEHIARLIEEHRMKPAGLKVVEDAKADGRWDNAYDSPSKMNIPDDFLKELRKDKRAYTFFKTLNKANLYSIVWRLQTARKPQTHRNRMKAILTMLADGRRFHSINSEQT
jgi:uncharacterized protein YdeI (YjbR/CyaY-like superfamily)